MVGKLLEGILKDRIYMYLEGQGLIRDNHRFVHEKLCLTNLIEFFEVKKKIDEGRAVDVIYMDYSKAFDKTHHGRLVSKVTGRTIHLNTELARSDVPQGLVLGPLLFIIYVNDLDVDIGSMVSKFADDIKVGDVADSKE
eukprot:g25770.t1